LQRTPREKIMELSDQLASFEQSIERLQGLIGDVAESDLSLDGAPNMAEISQQSALLPAQFQAIIAALNDAQLSPAVERQMGTYQTEAHRRLRLLGIEAMRLRTARQPASIARGQQQMSAHVSQLRQFVQAMQAAASE